MAKRGPLMGNEAEQLREPRKTERFIDKAGRELVDGLPMEPPIGYRREPSLAERIRSMVRGEQLAAEARAAGMETF